MKVTIDHGELTEGLFKKTKYYTVTVHVVFSEEEKHIIKTNDLGGTTLLKLKVPANRNPRQFVGIEDVFWLRIIALVNGPDTYVVATPGEARQYEEELKEALPRLKGYIEGNMPVENKSTSFEL